MSNLNGSMLTDQITFNLPFNCLNSDTAIARNQRAFRRAKICLAKRRVDELSDVVVQTDLVENTATIWQDPNARTDLRGHLVICFEDQVVDANSLQHVCQREAGYTSASDEDGEWLLCHGEYANVASLKARRNEMKANRVRGYGRE